MSERTYPVGVLATLLAVGRVLVIRDERLKGKRTEFIKRRVRGEAAYIKRQASARNWRAVRNSFNGYLCEHDGHPHNCGRGWTKRAAERRAAHLCSKASA